MWQRIHAKWYHQRFHEGEKEFKCNQCGQVFILKSDHLDINDFIQVKKNLIINSVAKGDLLNIKGFTLVRRNLSVNSVVNHTHGE